MKDPLPLFVCLLGLPLAAQRPVPLPQGHAGSFHGVFTSDPYADGAVWVRGDRYKLGLDARGATFQPLFGPRASRDYPLTLRVLGLSVGEVEVACGGGQWRGGEGHFEADRGAVRERWDCAPDHAQQSFVVARPGHAGSLVLDLGFRGELQAVGDGPGVRFVAPHGLGEVQYSDAVVIDANGARLDVPVLVDGAHLTITVPATFTAHAAWPIVVDPFLTTVAVDTSVSDIQDPRVACDPVSGNWLVVAEEHLSATDVDIICKRYDGSAVPVLLDTVYADNTADFTQNPDVGVVAQSGKFEIAWHTTAGIGGFGYRNRETTTTAQGVGFLTGVGTGANPANRPRIGSSLTSDMWVLVMFRSIGSNHDILARPALSSGLGFLTQFVGPIPVPTVDVEAGDISTLQDANDQWVVVWRECTDAVCSQMKIRMQAFGITPGGFQLVPSPSLDLVTSSFAQQPAVAGFGGHLLAVWRTLDPIGNSDIGGIPIGFTGGVLGPLGSVQNLTQQEPNVVVSRDQQRPAVSYDGCRFVYGYLEDNGFDTLLPHAATVFVSGSSIAWHEGHLPLPMLGTNNARSLDLGYGANGNFGVHWGVWQEDSGDVTGAVIDARTPGFTSVVSQYGCGTPSEPGIGLTGTPALGRTITVALNNVIGFPFLLVGPPGATLLPGCNGCQVGVDTSAMTALGLSSVSINIPCDPTLIHLQLTFQGLVMLQAGGCPSSLLGFDFTLSDALTIQVL